jgi:hypothetical protein
VYFAYARTMVNAGVVNAPAACSPQANFCEFFLAFARFLHSGNPVKYKRILQINQSIARAAPSTGGCRYKKVKCRNRIAA